MFALTEQQIKAYPYIKWLISHDWSHRAQGRTTLLAYCFIDSAMERIGRKVEVWDHLPYFNNRNRMIDVVKMVWDLRSDIDKEKYYIKISHVDMAISIKIRTDKNSVTDSKSEKM